MIEKGLLDTVRHIALATVNEDGTPHNTPLFFAYDDNFEKIYFVSRPDALHSKNMLRDGNAFAVIYDSNEFKGGIYITINNSRIPNGKELDEALKKYHARCDKFDIDVLPDNFHSANSDYRLFIGDVSKIEIYSSKEDKNNRLKQECRKEISAEELLK